MKRNCDNCGNEYNADPKNLKRGWGLCCSKSCAASKREKTKPGYDPERVKANNIRRANWANFGVPAPSIVFGSGRITVITSEGYRVMDGVAYDEFADPVYNVDEIAGDYDEGDSEYWNNKDY